MNIFCTIILLPYTIHAEAEATLKNGYRCPQT